MTCFQTHLGASLRVGSGDEDKTAEPAERSCAWGGLVITVNWFNMGMDGKEG